MNFKIEKKLKNSLGRAGVLKTAHGEINTPAFVPVGTKASVKALTPEQVFDLGAEVILANTYHLYLQPGDELVGKAGGLYKFMNWNGPIMTDSGGFQAFSLGVAYDYGVSKFIATDAPLPEIVEEAYNITRKNKKAFITEDGVKFQSMIDGSEHFLSPEKSIEIQHNLGADIIFAFDECTSPHASYEYIKEAMERTHRWAERSLARHQKLAGEAESSFLESLSGLASPALPPRPLSPERSDGGQVGSSACETLQKRNSASPALFGIVQGGRYKDLREKSAKTIGTMDFAGFGIGGSFIKEDMNEAVKWVNEILPEEKPRHLLGVGEPEDLFYAIENGCDLFDCVAPTRLARNGTLYTQNGKINIMNAKYKNDFQPIEKDCPCYTCKNYTRVYVSHLFHSKEILSSTLASIHNLYFIVNLVKKIRQSILDGDFFEFKERFLKNYLK
ncbi:queuine tRNA-ribosyltransferase [Candidatus Nomurabacteria bacterium]|nr:queuine tRNA-ribosyltransferase [Candidatus Nomurabacteria bacterium]